MSEAAKIKGSRSVDISYLIYRLGLYDISNFVKWFGGDFLGLTKKKSNDEPSREMVAEFDENNDVKAYRCEGGTGLGAGWVANYQEGFNWLSEQGLTGEQWNVLAYLFGHLEFENWLRVKQSDICQRLNMNQSNVSRAMRRLLELNVIVRGPAAGRTYTYRLNPRLAHKGKFSHYKNNVIQYDQLRARVLAGVGGQ